MTTTEPTITRSERLAAVIERHGLPADPDSLPGPVDSYLARFVGVQVSTDDGSPFYYVASSYREICEALESDLGDGWDFEAIYDLDTGQRHTVKMTLEVMGDVEGDVILPEPDLDASAVPGPNAPLGHVVDAMGDLNGFDEDELDETGWVAAHHATDLLRDAMGEDVPSHRLLLVAVYAIQRAGLPSGLAESLLFPLRAAGDPRDHVTLAEIGELLREAAVNVDRGVR